MSKVEELCMCCVAQNVPTIAIVEKACRKEQIKKITAWRGRWRRRRSAAMTTTTRHDNAFNGLLLDDLRMSAGVKKGVFFFSRAFDWCIAICP